jgi:hypothetical protein
VKTAIRRPKINKPSKGMKQNLKQGLKSIKKALAMAAGPTNRTGQTWYTPKQVRASYLFSLRGSHTPHQGDQEKARRVRQMAAGTHGY